MSRKNFLTADFFVTASEAQAKEAAHSLHQHFKNITLLKENTLLHTMRFLYEDADRSAQYYIDVSILFLNDQYVCFNLHGAYTNGQAIHSDAEISAALNHFEKGIHAVLKNDFSFLEVERKPKPVAKRTSYFANIFHSLLFSKYHY